MLVYSLPKSKLPPINKWYNPNYYGPGDYYVCEKLGIPRDSPNTCTDYVYEWEPYMELKHKLNKTKSKLDPIYKNPNSAKQYEKVSKLTQLSDLHGKYGMLVRDYNAEIVTNAWIKMFEMCAFLEPMLLAISVSKQKNFTSVHFAEAPGNFILAINHYINNITLRTQSSIDWQWFASTYRDIALDKRDNYYLNDQYGIIEKYKQSWFWGCENNGDITSPDNIRSFKSNIAKDEIKVHLTTSDVKNSPPGMDFAEEERINLVVHFGQVLCCLTTLSAGGTMIIKDLTMYESLNVSLIYLITCCFEKVYIVKPEASRTFNSEVYIIAQKYVPIHTDYIDRLLHILRYIREIKSGPYPSIFLKEQISNKFIESLTEINQSLHNRQVAALEECIRIFTTNAKVEKCDNTWVKHTAILPLLDSAKLLKGATPPL